MLLGSVIKGESAADILFREAEKKGVDIRDESITNHPVTSLNAPSQKSMIFGFFDDVNAATVQDTIHQPVNDGSFNFIIPDYEITGEDEIRNNEIKSIEVSMLSWSDICERAKLFCRERYNVSIVITLLFITVYPLKK